MAISNATRLSDFGSGIGTQGAIVKVDNANQRVGIGTTNPTAMFSVGPGAAIIMDGNAGVVTATSFSGSGANLTGIADTGFIDTADLTVSGIATFNGVLNADAEVTAAGGVDVTGGVKSAGIVSFTNTTASTSSATGALIVSGGVGIAGSLHVGENVSVGGTLTYEDVTNIDSVGVVTARLGVVATAGRGVEITAGGLNVTAGIATFKNEVDADGGVDIAGGLKVAGISTFGGSDIQIAGSATGITSVTWDASANSLIFKDSSLAKFGDSSDLEIYHQDSINYIKSTNASAPIQLQAPAGAVLGKFSPNGSVDLYHSGNKKFETTNDGTVTTGIGTFSTQININTNGSSIAENNLNFACSGIAYIDHRTVGKNITFRMSNGSALDTNAIIVGATGVTTFSDTPHDDLGSLRDVPRNSQSGAYVLVAADAGKCITITTGGVTINPSVMSAGNVVTIINDSGSNQTITQGSSMTLYDTGDDGSTGNKTLKGRGMCTVWFTSDNNAYITGNFA